MDGHLITYHRRLCPTAFSLDNLRKTAVSVNIMEIKSACPPDMNHKYLDTCVIIFSRQRICRFPSVTWKWTGCSFCRLAVLQMQNLKMAVLWYKNLIGNSWHQLTDLCIRQDFFIVQVFASSPFYHHAWVQCSRQSTLNKRMRWFFPCKVYSNMYSEILQVKPGSLTKVNSVSPQAG